MISTEERLRAATRAAADTVPPGSAPPLRLPPGGPPPGCAAACSVTAAGLRRSPRWPRRRP